MAGRQLLLFVFLLLIIGTVASALAPRPEQRAVQRPETVEPAPLPAADVVVGRLPAPRPVRARVGDVVRIEVAHDAADEVLVPALGLSEPVDRGIAAHLVFDADRAGRFPVVLRDAGKRLGTIDIRQAG